ncbi:MAG: class I adenylate cyclase [Spirochaetes bacterium]|nr:class I adenylate cyclase [Spirochaetota bacterium]HOD14643.1 class I adenylate cyclase [Spirochaetota bacterium]
MEANADIIKRIQAYQVIFQKYNELKLGNLQRALSEQQSINVLDMIPLLLNTNAPDLPGNVPGSRVPCGVYDYMPSPRMVDFVAKRFPNTILSKNKVEHPFIQMIALIGSCGTIAYTKQSDFDFWICYHEGSYDREAIGQFKAKLRTIESWIFDKYNMEIHFYLNEISRVRNNIFADDDEQLSGSSIGVLLKEEFLRSSIVLNGKMPFWWVVPSNADDATYDRWHAAAQETALADRFIDLGNLVSIRQEDFLAAALFQILKSLGNPFKSIIKLGLLERYLNNYMDNPFICNIIKKNIHQGKMGYHEIDAYVIMFDYVYDYYSSIVKDKDALEVLKTSFYLKVEPMLARHLSAKPEDGYNPEKARIMLEYVKKWSWPASKIKEMDDFHNWSIEPVSRLLNNAKKFVLQEYRRILGNIETHKVKHKFTDEEIKAISRKIYSHFLVSDTKIDNTLAFKNYPPEKLLKIEYVRDQKGNETWFLSKRLIVDNHPNIVILHKDRTLLGLAVWISLNGLFKKDYTRLEIDTGLHSLETNFLRELITDISTNFMFKKINAFREDYLKDPYPVMSYIIFNLYSKYSRKIEEIFFLYHDSWGSTKFEVFSREMDLLQIMVRVLNGCLVTKSDFESAVNIVSSSPFSSTKEFMRIKAFVRDIFDFFTNSDPDAKRSYITMIGNQYLVFYTRKSGTATVIDTLTSDSELKMLMGISFNYGLKSVIKIDQSIKELNFLRTMMEYAGPTAIRIYFDSDRKYAYFYVFDESGSLFFYRKPADLMFDYLTRLYIFAKNISTQVVAHNPKSLLANRENPVEIYQIKKDMYMNYSVTRLDPEHSIRLEDIQKKIQPCVMKVVMDHKTKEIIYSVTMPDGRRSEGFTKSNMRAVVQSISAIKAEGKDFNPFVTAADLTALQHNYFRFYSSYAFHEKMRAEIMLENALKQPAR